MPTNDGKPENEFERDMEASLKKHGYDTMCPFCGWSLKEEGHDIKECEQIAIEMAEQGPN